MNDELTMGADPTQQPAVPITEPAPLPPLPPLTLGGMQHQDPAIGQFREEREETHSQRYLKENEIHDQSREGRERWAQGLREARRRDEEERRAALYPRRAVDQGITPPPYAGPERRTAELDRRQTELPPIEPVPVAPRAPETVTPVETPSEDEATLSARILAAQERQRQAETTRDGARREQQQAEDRIFEIAEQIRKNGEQIAELMKQQSQLGKERAAAEQQKKIAAEKEQTERRVIRHQEEIRKGAREKFKALLVAQGSVVKKSWQNEDQFNADLEDSVDVWLEMHQEDKA